MQSILVSNHPSVLSAGAERLGKMISLKGSFPYGSRLSFARITETGKDHFRFQMHDSTRKIDQENLDELKLMAMQCQEKIVGIIADEVVSRMGSEEIGHEMQITRFARTK